MLDKEVKSGHADAGAPPNTNTTALPRHSVRLMHKKRLSLDMGSDPGGTWDDYAAVSMGADAMMEGGLLLGMYEGALHLNGGPAVSGQTEAVAAAASYALASKSSAPSTGSVMAAANVNSVARVNGDADVAPAQNGRRSPRAGCKGKAVNGRETAGSSLPARAAHAPGEPTPSGEESRGSRRAGREKREKNLGSSHDEGERALKPADASIDPFQAMMMNVAEEMERRAAATAAAAAVALSSASSHNQGVLPPLVDMGDLHAGADLLAGAPLGLEPAPVGGQGAKGVATLGTPRGRCQGGEGSTKKSARGGGPKVGSGTLSANANGGDDVAKDGVVPVLPLTSPRQPKPKKARERKVAAAPGADAGASVLASGFGGGLQTTALPLVMPMEATADVGHTQGGGVRGGLTGGATGLEERPQGDAAGLMEGINGHGGLVGHGLVGHDSHGLPHCDPPHADELAHTSDLLKGHHALLKDHRLLLAPAGEVRPAHHAAHRGHHGHGHGHHHAHGYETGRITIHLSLVGSPHPHQHPPPAVRAPTLPAPSHYPQPVAAQSSAARASSATHASSATQASTGHAPARSPASAHPPPPTPHAHHFTLAPRPHLPYPGEAVGALRRGVTVEGSVLNPRSAVCRHLLPAGGAVPSNQALVRLLDGGACGWFGADVRTRLQGEAGSGATMAGSGEGASLAGDAREGGGEDDTVLVPFQQGATGGIIEWLSRSSSGGAGGGVNDMGEEEPSPWCAACGSMFDCMNSGNEVPIIACDERSCGCCFHLDCIHPLPAFVPDGAWYCPRCAASAPPGSHVSTAVEAMAAVAGMGAAAAAASGSPAGGHEYLAGSPHSSPPAWNGALLSLVACVRRVSCSAAASSSMPSPMEPQLTIPHRVLERVPEGELYAYTKQLLTVGNSVVVTPKWSSKLHACSALATFFRMMHRMRRRKGAAGYGSVT